MEPSWLVISHSYCPPSRASTLTMMSSWLSVVKKWHPVGVRGPPSLRQGSWGRGLPLLWHSSAAVTPTLITLSTLGFTNLGTSSTAYPDLVGVCLGVEPALAGRWEVLAAVLPVDEAHGGG